MGYRHRFISAERKVMIARLSAYILLTKQEIQVAHTNFVPHCELGKSLGAVYLQTYSELAMLTTCLNLPHTKKIPLKLWLTCVVNVHVMPLQHVNSIIYYFRQEECVLTPWPVSWPCYSVTNVKPYR